MGKRSRICRVCSRSYEYCPTCSQDKYKPTWMVEFHDENCKTIWDICTRFNMELMSKEEAKAALLKCDLDGKEYFADCVQRDLAKIFAVDEPVAKKREVKKPIEMEAHEVVNTK